MAADRPPAAITAHPLPGIPAFAQNLNLLRNIKTAAAIVSCSARRCGGQSSSAQTIR